MRIHFLFRAGVILVMLGVLALLPAGCGQKKEEPPANPGGNQNGNPGASSAEAKKRTLYNLKEIGMAMHNYEANHRFFPVGMLDPKTGKLGLSWRVLILPYLGDPQAEQLFKKFRQDEPWDSEHNKKLLTEMPKAFAPVHGQAPPGHTFYQGFAAHMVQPNRQELPETANISPQGNPFIFPDPRTKYPVHGKPTPNGGIHVPGRGISQFPDGTSNTILVAEAGEAVPWTKPQDIPMLLVINSPLPDNRYMPKLGGMFGGDAHVLIADGSTNFVRKNPPQETLLAFITPSGGEVVDGSTIFGK